MIDTQVARARTGEDLTRAVSNFSFGFTLSGLLTDKYGLDTTTALDIETDVRTAEVLYTTAGALALTSPTIVEQDDDGAIPISRAIFPRNDAMIINTGLTRLLAETMHNNGHTKTIGEQSTLDANRVSAIFELGRFLNKKLYDLVILSTRDTHLPSAVPAQQPTDFYARIVENLASRDVQVSIDMSKSNTVAARQYYIDQLLPERFFAAGGLDLVRTIYPFLGIHEINGSIHSYVYDNVQPEEDGTIAGHRLLWSDLAAATPLDADEYLRLRSFSEDPDKVTSISPA